MYFDLVMPSTLFAVILAGILLEKKVEPKLKGLMEEKEFGIRNVVLLVVAMGATVSLIVFVPQAAIMTIFLFAYSMLLFTFTLFFSNFQKNKVKLLLKLFLVCSFLVAAVSLFLYSSEAMIAYGALAFFCLFGFAFLALLHEYQRVSIDERWYLAVIPPALFISIYLFFNRTTLWFPYLQNLYGLVFAVLIVLYLGSVFTWKATLAFVGLLTIMDVILVLVTGSMISAARHVSTLRLPVLISLPIVPTIITEWGVLYMSLGLGDLFFAGLIGIQTKKKYGNRLAIASVVAMAMSFFIFELFILNYEVIAFPGTVMIICGWLPLVLWKSRAELFYISLAVLSLAISTFLLVNYAVLTFISSLSNTLSAYASLGLYCLSILAFLALLYRKICSPRIKANNH